MYLVCSVAYKKGNFEVLYNVSYYRFAQLFFRSLHIRSDVSITNLISLWAIGFKFSCKELAFKLHDKVAPRSQKAKGNI